MAEERATVACPDCDLEASFDKLADARSRIEEHRRETGHEPVWELHRLSEGVEQAGEEAGVCGLEDCGDEESALFFDGQEY